MTDTSGPLLAADGTPLKKQIGAGDVSQLALRAFGLTPFLCWHLSSVFFIVPIIYAA